MQTDELTTDYVTEAMTLLTGAAPVIHKIEHPYELPGSGLYKAWLYKTEAEARTFQGREAWMLESKIITAWYLFVPLDADAP